MISPLSPASLDAVRARLELARPFPGEAYTSDAVFAFERARIFGRSWICVGREEDLKLSGQWIREIVAGEPVLIVRGADLELRAFHDVCRHRGASLVERAECGRDSRLACPYHGWTYELDGRLTLAPLTPPGFDRSAHGLSSVRVEAWRGFVFVCLDPAAEPLTDWFGSVPPWFAEALIPSLVRGRRVVYETTANWKLCVENFQESHHFPTVHRSLEHLTPTGEARSWLGGGRWLGGTMEITRGETVSLDGELHRRPRIVDASRARRVHDAMLFPCLLTSLQPDYLLTYRLVPLAADRTRIVAEIHFHPAAVSPGFDPRDVYDFWDRVNDEDRAICEDQQANASSRAFAPACYVMVEEGVHAFDRMVAEAHLDPTT